MDVGNTSTYVAIYGLGIMRLSPLFFCTLFLLFKHHCLVLRKRINCVNWMYWYHQRFLTRRHVTFVGRWIRYTIRATETVRTVPGAQGGGGGAWVHDTETHAGFTARGSGAGRQRQARRKADQNQVGLVFLFHPYIMRFWRVVYWMSTYTRVSLW